MEPVIQINEAQYETVVTMRLENDAKVWRTPLLCIAAQSLLMNVALGNNFGSVAATIASLLAFISSLASIQVMMKHRYLEIKCSKILHAFEQEENDYGPLHQKPTYQDAGFIEKRTSYKLWIIIIVLFVCFSLAVMLWNTSYYLGWTELNPFSLPVSPLNDTDLTQ